MILDRDHHDALQDARAEHNLATGDNLTLADYLKLTTPEATPGGREDHVRVAQRFPSRAMVIHGRATQQAGPDGRDARPQSTEVTP